MIQMLIKTYSTLFLLFSFGIMPNVMGSSIKVIFWSKPTLFAQSRTSMVKHLGFFNTFLNARRALHIQEELFQKMCQNFGVQTQHYKANDPETNLPLPLIMREWLTGEKSPEEIKKLTNHAFKKDKFITKLTQCIFTPKYMIDATYIVEDALKLVMRIKRGITQVLASNYDAASYEALKKTPMAKRVFPHFKHVYNSGVLKPSHKGLVLQDPAFFKLIIDEHAFKPEECLVITSDPDVRDAALHNGMQVVFYKHGDYESIKKQLQELYLLV